MAMDTKSRYGFDKTSVRNKCWEAIKRDKSKLVIGSPPCTMFARRRKLSKFMYKDSRVCMLKFEDLLGQAKRYVKFGAEIYEYQRVNGQYFLRERPWLATS